MLKLKSESGEPELNWNNRMELVAASIMTEVWIKKIEQYPVDIGVVWLAVLVVCSHETRILHVHSVLRDEGESMKLNLPKEDHV